MRRGTKSLVWFFAFTTTTTCITAYKGQSILVAQNPSKLFRMEQPQSIDQLSRVVCGQKFVDYRLSGDGEGGVTFATEKGWVEDLGGVFITNPYVGYPFPIESSLLNAADEIQAALTNGLVVVVHCKRGKDRTGGVIAAWELKYTSMSLKQVLKERTQYLALIDEIIDVEETVSLIEIAKKLGK